MKEFREIWKRACESGKIREIEDQFRKKQEEWKKKKGGGKPPDFPWDRIGKLLQEISRNSEV